jgi:sulfur carrier protein ThiS
MSESPSSTLRNTRKHFVKCVDCRTQTLPQNASTWTAASALFINGHVNDGALCLKCANKRRAALGLPVEVSETSAPVCDKGPKKIRINRREYSWEVSTLDSLLTKWRDEYPNPTFRNRKISHLVVTVNKELIRAKDFSSVPISDGDEITIAAGAIGGG